jgi:uncharacterized membrane protein
MIGRLIPAFTFAAALGVGLVSGLFFAFSAFVMKALGRLPAEQGIAAMQSISVTVLNPLFGTVFFGTAVLCLVLTVVAFLRWNETGVIYLVVGGLLYLVGTFGVTAAINVPMNDALAAVAPNSAEGAALWARYLVRWTAWNHVRTITALLALASFIGALRR